MKYTNCKCGRLVSWPERKPVQAPASGGTLVINAIKTCRCYRKFNFARPQMKPKGKTAG